MARKSNSRRPTPDAAPGQPAGIYVGIRIENPVPLRIGITLADDIAAILKGWQYTAYNIVVDVLTASDHVSSRRVKEESAESAVLETPSENRLQLHSSAVPMSDAEKRRHLFDLAERAPSEILRNVYLDALRALGPIPYEEYQTSVLSLNELIERNDRRGPTEDVPF